MKIKILKQKNKIILIDNTLSSHTKIILDSMLSTLNAKKNIIDLNNVFNDTTYLNPLLNHVGYKSMANMIVPKHNSKTKNREFINHTRLLLSELLSVSETFHGKLCPYLLLSDLSNIQAFSIKCLSLKLINEPLALIFNQFAKIKIINQLEKIIACPQISKQNNAEVLKQEIILEEHLKNEEVFYIYSSNNNDIVNGLILNSLKAIDKKDHNKSSDEWDTLSRLLIDEVNLFNTSPTVHSDSFLNKC